MDELMRALKRVVEDWGVCEILLFVVFIPWSFLYLGLRLIQEFDKDEEAEE